jgi:hypothetical protein
VAEALEDLPLIGAAFRRGRLGLAKVRALTRVATPACEQGLLDLAEALTASQLDRALRVFRRLRAEQANDSHELEYVDYHWAEDGSLVLRARLPAEDGTLLVKALDAARERVYMRHRAEMAAREQAGSEDCAGGRPSGEPGPAAATGEPERPRTPTFEAGQAEPPRAPNIEALVELAQRALAHPADDRDPEPARLVVHVDAAALIADASGRCELEDGPVIAPETARRLGCDAEHLASIESDGLPLGVGRSRRTVPPRLRRVLEARDGGCCRWPGCDRRRRLAAHHRTHWAHGGETSLDNLVLLCHQHHRLVHEGGYTIEDGETGELRFRNRHGLLCPSIPRSPPGSVEGLVARNVDAGLTMTDRTSRGGHGDPMDLSLTIDALGHVVGW